MFVVAFLVLTTSECLWTMKPSIEKMEDTRGNHGRLNKKMRNEGARKGVGLKLKRTELLREEAGIESISYSLTEHKKEHFQEFLLLILQRFSRVDVAQGTREQGAQQKHLKLNGSTMK